MADAVAQRLSGAAAATPLVLACSALQRHECGMMLDIAERPAELARKAAAGMRDTPATPP